MKERPILFSAPMVRAILAGQKTQTRRVVKLTGHDGLQKDHAPWIFRHGAGKWLWQHATDKDRVITEACPYGAPGDRLWVRETWAAGACADGLPPSTLHAPTWLRDNGGLWYKADPSEHRGRVSTRGRWRPSIHMPRWASRIGLRIGSIHVERLRDISERDAIAEGVGSLWDFSDLWARINGQKSLESNPWVWVIAFHVEAA